MRTWHLSEGCECIPLLLNAMNVIVLEGIPIKWMGLLMSTYLKKEGKMKMMRVIQTLVLAITIGFFPTTTHAEDVEWQVTSYITKIEFIPVPDVEGHAVGIFERRGTAIYKNGETAAYHTRGTWDFIKSNGLFNGYTTMTFEDGSMVMAKYKGDMTTEPEKLPTFSGKGEYIKGTGKYEGIKGNLSFSGKYITPFNKETKGDNVINAKGTYTLSK